MSEKLDQDSQAYGPAWGAAIADGLDMSLVELSLQKTPWERMLEHDEALEFADQLRAAGAKLYEQA
jgi:hypothetical protein